MFTFWGGQKWGVCGSPTRILPKCIAYLKERLDFAPLDNLFLAHTFCNLTWIPINSGNKSMSKRLVWSSFIIRFDDYGLSTRESSAKDKYNCKEIYTLSFNRSRLYWTPQVSTIASSRVNQTNASVVLKIKRKTFKVFSIHRMIMIITF